MLKKLHEAALAGLVVPAGADKTTEREILRRRRQVEAQLSLARRAIQMLKSLHADISALRVDDGDGFQGTGSCEYGHDGVEVTLEWPNLAILTDEIRALLEQHTEAEADARFWFVFYGDCENPFRCEADDRVEALDIFTEEHPGISAYVVVPADEQGTLVLEYYGEDAVHCPKCGSRTDFNDLPREGYQAHACLRCNHSFVAVPDEDELPSMRLSVADEVIADIAFTAGRLMGSGGLVAFPYSRQMTSEIIDWANAFELVFDKDSHGDDYKELVGNYATYRLTGEHDKAESVLDDMEARVTA